MSDRKVVNIRRLSIHGLHAALLEVFELWEQGYRIPDPRVTRKKEDWPRIGLGGKHRIVLVKESVEDASKPVDEVKFEPTQEDPLDSLKAQYKELTGKGTNIKDPVKLEAKIKEIEASKA